MGSASGMYMPILSICCRLNLQQCALYLHTGFLLAPHTHDCHQTSQHPLSSLFLPPLSHSVLYYSLKVLLLDFPGGSVVKNPPASAGDRFKPWSGKIPHATEQLSPQATTMEPVR